MGLAAWLMDIGIRIEETVQHFGVRRGAVPLAWPAGPRGSLIYRLPRDPHQRASIFATQQSIVVNEGEVAVVLEDGKGLGALPPGRYVFQKARVVGSIDIVWMVTGQQALKWGIGNVASIDGIQLSSNGVLYVRVMDGGVFNAEVVQGAVTLAEVDLQRLLMPRIQGVLRATLARWPALDLQTQREIFSDAVKGALTETLARMGLAVVDFEVVEVGFPPEFKAVIAQAAMAQHGGRASLIEAQTRAHMAQIEAAATAQSQLTAGMVQVQLMAQYQAHGIDPLKVKALEALQTFAENPAQGSGSLIGGDVVRAQVVGQLAMATLAQPGAAAHAAPPPQLPARAAPVVGAIELATGEPTTADLERQLDNLTERLAEGKITEETYNKLALRLEARLAKLRGDG
jgi:regulator of protease activity HflC (stomatin/prohibitin superfamily)